MLRISEITLVFIFILKVIHCHDFKGFDDTVLFKINWPGPLSEELLVRFCLK